MDELSMRTMKKPCRLCYYETTDTIEIFSQKGLEQDYKGKINKYLYLKVHKEDIQPKTVCWMCSQHLETFHKFYEKINEIQKSMLKDGYEFVVLRPDYKDEDMDDIEDNQTVDVLVINSTDDNNYHHIDIDLLPENNMSKESHTFIDIDEEGLPIETDIEQEDITIVEQLEDISEEINEDDQNDGSDDVTTTYVNPKNGALIKEESSEFNEANSKEATSIGEEVDLEGSEIKTDDHSQSSVPTESFTVKVLSEDATLKDILNSSLVKVENENAETIMYPSSSYPTKRKRGRPKKMPQKKSVSQDSTSNENEQEAIVPISKQKNTRTRSTKIVNESPLSDIEEGESDNEFPARDSDNEDWPAQATLNEFPKKILMDGYLLVKGKRLMTMISKYYKLDCDLCPDKPRFKQLKDLFGHYTDIHRQEGYVVCCQTKLSRYPAIIMHMARHLQPDAFKCDECGYMVTRPRFLQSHKQTHLPQNLKPFKCVQCDRRFCWKGALQIHMISHQKPEERKLYVCHICGKVYDTPGGLSTHKKQIHSEKKPISNVCHVCAKKFATRTGLNEHMATIHQPREKDQVQCTECGKWLMNQRCLKSHMILHSDTTYNCHICSYETKKKVLLKRHFLTQHSDEKPYNCDLCQKSFKLKRALTVHIAQHNNSRSYKCTFCERQFNSSTNFYTHRKNMHPVELQKLKDEILEKQRQKRIMAGIETANLQNNKDEDYIDEETIEKQVSAKPRRKILKLDRRDAMNVKRNNEVSVISNEKLTEQNEIEILVVAEECKNVSANSQNVKLNDQSQILTTIIPVKSVDQQQFLIETRTVLDRNQTPILTRTKSGLYQQSFVVGVDETTKNKTDIVE